jgi:MSHA biogenesis protein MshL
MKRLSILGRIAAALAVLTLLAGGAARLPLQWLSPSSSVRAEVAAQAKAATATAAAPVPAPAPAPAPAGPRPVAAAGPAATASAAAEPPPEARFDLIVSGALVRDVFQAMVSDTRYSMLMHPEVTGSMSVTLRSVTVREALESIRDVYGYDFRMDGRRITVYPPTMQTRIFTVNYLTSQRKGRSDVRVTSSSAPFLNANNGGSGGGGGSGNNSNAGGNSSAPDNSQITTTSNSDFWTETADALRGLLGKAEGRLVITSPQAGTIAVRAMPDELRQVDQFLRASRMAVERQVMLEAKIVEVELREGYQSGIDWSLLGATGAAGQASGVTNNALVANNRGLPTLPSVLASTLLDTVGLPAASSGTLGLSLATKGFQAVLGFLESHGDVQILSSPRVATLNNQKAVLKVGVDEYFVTGVTGGSTSNNSGSSGSTTSTPTVTLTPFFSGIALDVTPQIDEAGMVTLHLRPSVTAVSEKTKQVDLGSAGNYKLPLASSSVNETDTVVRVPDGQIVAIGGLMQTELNNRQSGVPGSNGNAITRTLFGNRNDSGRKRELVVLIKPTIIRNADDWQRSTDQALAHLQPLPQRTVVVKAQESTTPATASAPAPAATASSAGTGTR